MWEDFGMRQEGSHKYSRAKAEDYEPLRVLSYANTDRQTDRKGGFVVTIKVNNKQIHMLQCILSFWLAN